MKNTIEASASRVESIQGMRAIAVAGVLLFHVGFSTLPGGFLGVDIFFVISGFVISKLLIRDNISNSFSFSLFYVRRAWRLLPSLAVTLFGTALVFGLLMPSVLNNTLQPALISSAFGVSNFYFSKTLDYFDSGITNPLLHTWSLGVEEQFYLVFPILFFVVFKTDKSPGKHKIFWSMCIFCIAGLIGATITTITDRSLAFYMPWLRAWEFLVGATIALRLQFWQQSRMGTVASAFGLAMIFASFIFYKEQYLFPGIGALPAVTGIGFLLSSSNQTNLINSILQSRFLVFIGNISYTLYLVHWPIVCLAGLIAPINRTRTQIFIVSSSLVAAYILTKLVEIPCKSKTLRTTKLTGIASLPASMMLVAGICAAIIFGTENLWRNNPAASRFLEHPINTTDFFRTGTCFLSQKTPFEGFSVSTCLSYHPIKKNILVLGDSLAANISLSLQRNYPTTNIMQATSVDYRPGNPLKWPPFTSRLNDLVEDLIKSPRKPEIVIIFARWDADDLDPLIIFNRHLKSLGIKTLVLGPSPEFFTSLPLILAHSELLGVDLQSKLQRSERWSLDGVFKNRLREISNYYSSMEIMCPARKCKTTILDNPVYFDKLHFTPLGADYFTSHLDLQNFIQNPRFQDGPP